MSVTPNPTHVMKYHLPWQIIGCGRVGQMLALWANSLGLRVSGVWNRSNLSSDRVRECVSAEHYYVWTHENPLPLAMTEPAVVWLTVSDDVLIDVADAVLPHLAPGTLVFHTSGSLSASLLRDIAPQSLYVGSLHPLQAITDPQRALDKASSCTWTLEGDIETVHFAKELLATREIDPILLKEGAQQKILYHTAAVMAANLLVSLMDASIAVSKQAGICEGDARTMLVQLAQSSLDNLREQCPADALSGPVARGDALTIEKHINALEELGDLQISQVYKLLTDYAYRLKNQ